MVSRIPSRSEASSGPPPRERRHIRISSDVCQDKSRRTQSRRGASGWENVLERIGNGIKYLASLVFSKVSTFGLTWSITVSSWIVMKRSTITLLYTVYGSVPTVNFLRPEHLMAKSRCVLSKIKMSFFLVIPPYFA